MNVPGVTSVAEIIKPLVKVEQKLQKHVDSKNLEVDNINQKLDKLATQKSSAETEISKAKAYAKKIANFLNIEEEPKEV